MNSFQAVEEEFQPSDAPEQCMEKRCTLKYTHSVAMYMNEVDALHNTWRLCEKAEFGLALQGHEERIKRGNTQIHEGEKGEMGVRSRNYMNWQ